MLPRSARALIESGVYGHLATRNESGSTHVTLCWVGIEGDDLVVGTLFDQRKLQNLRRDPRVTVSFAGDRVSGIGLLEYLVVKGRAAVTEGGAPELLARLAPLYLGPGVKFPPMPDPPPGYITRISVDHIGGVGPWMDEVAGRQ